MKKFELSLSPDYCSSWTVVDAVRELFQNAIDQEAQQPENKFSWEYRQGCLRIANVKSVLEAKTLLMGTTSKKGAANTIGQFGEGYKVASLVLLRLGYELTIYNYVKKEIWKPRFVNSKRYDAQVLTYFVETVPFWEEVPENSLVIVVKGLTESDWEKISLSNLYIRPPVEEVKTPFGSILLDEDRKGQVFVNGLYVTTYEPYEYGYNFKPDSIKLDRDRKLVSDFDLKWLACQMWETTEDERILEMLPKGCADIDYMRFGPKRAIADMAYDRFRAEYGENAVPISTQEELTAIPQGYKAVVVTEVYRNVIQQSSKYVAPQCTAVSLKEQFIEWLATYEEAMLKYVGDDAVEQVKLLIDQIR